ncbi:methanol dehydrogenase [Sphingobium indicum IP26]|uniref:Methanol dehydrogenase n=1 Tax=Sphingobium indicum F2 TaxID=1450518 RepID=A0A8E0WUU4_9SPHN|nr:MULTISPECIES: TPM domain-containing protein [Sphingobium]EPR16237.1 methanol dehydrogenase [Sphingobium indicum IP26]EQB01683.1 methanol dehydrogenase [Sphingobium sp. HDIP04]KER37827.1 methanol dehydrogenase [Sphingobium indicum F2]
MLRRLFLILALLVFMPAAGVTGIAPSAQAQTFPKLTGRVVDDAALLSSQQEQALTDKLAALERQSGRQLVVATLPDLQGYDISDYGYRLGRAWGIGDKEKNEGALLIVAPNERKVRIEVGYGLEGIMTDALSSQIIRNAITPRFKAGDLPGGIDAGVDAIGKLLTLPPDEARALAAQAEAKARDASDDGGTFMAIFWLIIVAIIVIAMLSGRGKGRRYRGGSGPIILWGPGDSGWGGGGGSGWGGGGWGGGGGGFSGGGGSFGGGGASGDW